MQTSIRTLNVRPTLTSLLYGVLNCSVCVVFSANLLAAQTTDFPSHTKSDPITKDENANISRAVTRYSEIVSNGGWSPVIANRTLKEGMTGSDVDSLVSRLKIEEGTVIDACETDTPSISNRVARKTRHNTTYDLIGCKYTENIVSAVKTFQKRHGLKADGVVGRGTLDALNVSADARLKQLKLNKRRLQNFPAIVDNEYVYVNIPEFKLRYVYGGKVQLRSKVVVGKPNWATPSFSDQIEKFVVNPDWRIPRSIATSEIAPKVANDPDYLEENDIVIKEKSYIDENEVDPSTIDWEEITANDFDYFLVKQPGDENPLGEIKYLFPNKDAIYVHDTPAKAWFGKTGRAASHGCIRMEDPFALAQAFANQRENFDLEEKIEVARETDKLTTFHLNEPIPIHLVYWTAWVDSDDVVHFRKDIYNRDSADEEVEIASSKMITMLNDEKGD